MEFSVSTDIEQLAASTNLTPEQVQHVTQLLDAGYSIPYLVRYRRAEIGNLDEESLTELRSSIRTARQLSDRKQAVLRAASHHEPLTAELERAIRSAKAYRALEDLHLPFRRRKRSKDSHARRERLRELVAAIVDANQQVALEDTLAALSNDATLAGDLAELQAELRQLIAEHFLYSPSIRQALRETIEQNAVLVSEHLADTADEGIEPATAPAAETVCGTETATDDSDDASGLDVGAAADPEVDIHSSAADELSDRDLAETPLPDPTPEAHPAPGPSESIAQLRREQRREARRKRRRRLESYYRPFFRFRKAVRKITACEWAGLDRGEQLRVLQVHYEMPVDLAMATCEPLIAVPDHPRRSVLLDAVREALVAEIPVLAKEVQRDLVTAGELRWHTGQRQKLRRLLLRRDVRDVVLAIEPQIRRESTVVVLDCHGKLLAHANLLLAKDPHSVESRQQLEELLARHHVRYVVLGDSPGYREVYPWLAAIQDQVREISPFELALVRSAGTGLFARNATASRDLASQPDNIRRAVSLGRRFQTPLQEFARLDIGRIARLLFGEETKSDSYDEFMQDAVRSCVAQLGIDANLAEESLIRFVPAMNLAYAQRLVQARKETGGFPNRNAILAIEGIDRQALQQAVAFLRVDASDNPFDATDVHPEDEPLARQILVAAELGEQDVAAVLPRSRVPAREAASPDPSLIEAWRNKLRAVDIDSLARSSGSPPERIALVRRQLEQIPTDPCEQLPLPPTRIGPIQFDLLQRWDQVVGIVANLAPFGAFVDLGDKLVGLLHVSRMADQYISDPRELVDEGEQLLMWVTEVEQDKGRIALSLKEPRERKERPWREKMKREPQPGHKPRTPPPRPHHDKPTRAPRQFGKRTTQPVVPITEAMKEGAEPMRTFSDLAQFFEHQKKGGKPGKSNRDKDQHD